MKRKKKRNWFLAGKILLKNFSAAVVIFTRERPPPHPALIQRKHWKFKKKETCNSINKIYGPGNFLTTFFSHFIFQPPFFFFFFFLAGKARKKSARDEKSERLCPFPGAPPRVRALCSTEKPPPLPIPHHTVDL
jgi:hypothetical protein